MRKIFKILLWTLGLFLLYPLIVILHGMWTDYVPAAQEPLQATQSAPQAISLDSSYSFLIWNIGYCGLGAKSDFFYHGSGFFSSGGKMVHSPEDYVQENFKGVKEILKNNPVDFLMLQEVDYASKRSYYIDQHAAFGDLFPNYYGTQAHNYKVARVPAPILQPWKAYGHIESGLSSFTRYEAAQSTRYQLPGEFAFPTKYFMLDRCLLVSRYPLPSGKELLVVNIHNAAFDKDGSIKAQQTKFLKDFLQKEYAKGNYLVVGGDWNQCPPGFQFDILMEGRDNQGYTQSNIPEDFLPEGWQFVYDPQMPSNRKNREIYQPGTTFITIIDFFLISPNVEALSVEGIDTEFAYSDHQPVKMEVRLR